MTQTFPAFLDQHPEMSRSTAAEALGVEHGAEDVDERFRDEVQAQAERLAVDDEEGDADALAREEMAGWNRHGWDTAAINAGAASVVEIPSDLAEAYYRGYDRGARAAHAQIAVGDRPGDEDASRS